MKSRDLIRMTKEERQKKLDELKLELVKSNVKGKVGNSKAKEIKKFIARLLTIDKTNKK